MEVWCPEAAEKYLLVEVCSVVCRVQMWMGTVGQVTQVWIWSHRQWGLPVHSGHQG